MLLEFLSCFLIENMKIPSNNTKVMFIQTAFKSFNLLHENSLT